MNRKLLLKISLVCIILILVLVVMYSGLQILESTLLLPRQQEQEQMQTTSRTITRDGVKYYPRQDLTVVMLMGVNRQGKVEATEPNHGGAVDMVMLVIFDEKTREYSVLGLNRDMMVDMPALNEHGRETGVINAQLAYAHTYGDGMERSCENVRKTVANLLYGAKVNYYFALNMDTIGPLNDAVGGVTVDVTDDFSAVDPSLPMGRVTLTGDQAVTFVQSRLGVGDQLNLSRMERQKTYMRGFIDMLKQKLEEKPSFVMDAYRQVADFIVTDCSVEVLDRLAADYSGYTMGRFLNIRGENVLGEKYYEFYADEEALDTLILETFYAPKK